RTSSGRGRCDGARASRHAPARRPGPARARQPRTARRAGRRQRRSGRARRPRRAARRPAGHFPAVGDRLRRTRTDSLGGVAPNRESSPPGSSVDSAPSRGPEVLSDRHYHRGVLRPSSLLPARAVVTALVLTLLTLATVALTVSRPGASYAGAAPRDPEQPLVLRMRSITPDFVPARGPVIVRGTVTNASDQEWTAINVHGFIGDTPMTSTAELAAATHTPLTADVGSRITVPGTFDSIASLLPGQTKTFKVRLTRAALGVTAPGVYWFGVHVLGNNGEGGDRVAVGRDR